jgi:hypothetical protein
MRLGCAVAGTCATSADFGSENSEFKGGEDSALHDLSLGPACSRQPRKNEIAEGDRLGAEGIR